MAGAGQQIDGGRIAHFPIVQAWYQPVAGQLRLRGQIGNSRHAFARQHRLETDIAMIADQPAADGDGFFDAIAPEPLKVGHSAFRVAKRETHMPFETAWVLHHAALGAGVTNSMPCAAAMANLRRLTDSDGLTSASWL